MQKLDQTIAIAAPEFIVFRYHTAGPSIRIFAALLDHLIIAFILICALFLFALSAACLPGQNAAGVIQFLLFLVFFIVYWLYFFLFEWLNRGRTPGKMAFQIRVSSADGTALDVSQLLIRNLVRIADVLPVWPLFWLFFIPSGVIGLISMFASAPAFQRLGDLAGRTLVIRDQPESGREIQLQADAAAAELASDLQLRYLPAADFVRALNEYMVRRPLLHPERRAEITAPLQPFVRDFCQFPPGRSMDEVLAALHHTLFQLDTEKRGAA
ncbi:MAG: RDD family protein [Spirochaetales bacterium]|nr:RDD family protein [Spirochaetales bacterium]